MHYTIIGGGALGSTLAARLHHHGERVQVVERDAVRRARLARGLRVTGNYRGPETHPPVVDWEGVHPDTDAVLLCVGPADATAASQQAAAAFPNRPPLVVFVGGIGALRLARDWSGEAILAVTNLEVRLDDGGNPETGFHNFTWLGNLDSTETDAMRAVQRDLAWLSPTLTTKVIEGMVWSKAVFTLEAALPVLAGVDPRAFYDDPRHVGAGADLVREGLAVAAATGVTPIAFDFFDPNLYPVTTPGERRTLEAWVRHCWQRHEQYRVGAPVTFTEPAGLGWSLDGRNPREELSVVVAELRAAADAAGLSTPRLAGVARLAHESRGVGPVGVEPVLAALAAAVAA